MGTDKREKRKGRLKSGKIKDLLIIAGVALFLEFAVWRIFYKPDVLSTQTGVSGTESERALTALLGEIEGVGEVNVMICEDEEGVQSVVVVCDGAKNIRVNSDIREAVAAALGTEEKNVKIYLKKD